MEGSYVLITFRLVGMVTLISADYDCICNYAVESPVYNTPDKTSQPAGYVYEFDCKPEIGETIGFYIIALQHQKQYIAVSEQTRQQVCPGVPPESDRLITTSAITTKITTPIMTRTTLTTTTTIPDTTTTIPTTTTTPLTTTTTYTTTTAAKSQTTAQVIVTWPVGSYGVMQTAEGCPGGGTTWKTGWRKQDTEDNEAGNYYTADIQNYIAGSFARNDLVTKFCIKDEMSPSKFDRQWPNGTYCILKHKNCPSGFNSGFIYWDDEDHNNRNWQGGVLPDGRYDRNTLIYYCCRNDANTTIKIILPTETTFVLLRYGNTCQSVKDMTVKEVYLRWDDEDDDNETSRGGAHPYDDGGGDNHILHFCYYQPSSEPSFVG